MKLRKILIGTILAALCVTSLSSCKSGGNASGDSSSTAEATSESSSPTAEATNESSSPDLSGNIGDVEILPGDTVAEIEVEGFGTIKAKLFPDIAPIGVENFKQLADKGYYDGKNIHRVVESFMLQGGSENGDGTGGDAAYTGGDSSSTDFGTEINRNARHFYGALCYANALGRNTTQFYIVNSKEPQDISNVDLSDLETSVEILKKYVGSAEPGSAEYKYYSSMQKQYEATADWLKSPTKEEINKYKEVGGVYYLDGGYTVFGQVVEGLDVVDKISAVEVTENSSGELSQPVEDIIIKTVRVYTAE